MRKLFVASLIGVGLLAGCGIGGENGYGRPETPIWHLTASEEVKRNYFQDQCLKFGYKRNTTEMMKCIQDQSNLSKYGRD